MAANVPLQDDTGHLILAALQDLAAAVRQQTAMISEVNDALDFWITDRQDFHRCLQNGWTYTPKPYS